MENRIKITRRTILGLAYGYSSDGNRNTPDITGTAKTLQIKLDAEKCYQANREHMSTFLLAKQNGNWKNGKLCMGFINGKPVPCSLSDALDSEHIEIYGDAYFYFDN